MATNDYTAEFKPVDLKAPGVLPKSFIFCANDCLLEGWLTYTPTGKKYCGRCFPIIMTKK